MQWGNNYNYKNNPCKDCPNKGCGAFHSQCKDYKMWSLKIQRDREIRRKEREIRETLQQLADHRINTKLRRA